MIELADSRHHLLSLIGNTALVELKKMQPNKNVRIFAKMESQNIGGSVKARPAYSMFLEAEKRGTLRQGVKLIEPTSGNTGIALAMLSAIKDYTIELVMPENASVERRKVMRAYGAELTLTPASKEMEGAIDYVNDKIANEKNLLMLNQFSNQDNPLAHYKSTGPEIWRDTDGQITHFVSAMGTTGTIMGVSRFLKEKKPSIEIIGARPNKGSSIPGIRRWPEAYLPKIFDARRVDDVRDVSSAQAAQTTRLLAQKEGIFAGMSAGGACHIALSIAKEISEGVIVFIVCDSGDKYLSTDLFSL